MLSVTQNSLSKDHNGSVQGGKRAWGKKHTRRHLIVSTQQFEKKNKKIKNLIMRAIFELTIQDMLNQK